MQCERCAANIRGVFHDSVAGVTMPVAPPLCCHKCRAPYPWSEARLAEAQAFAFELSALTDGDQRALAEAYEAILLGTPRPSAAVATVVRLATRVGEPAATMLRQFLRDVSGQGEDVSGLAEPGGARQLQ